MKMISQKSKVKSQKYIKRNKKSVGLFVLSCVVLFSVLSLLFFVSSAKAATGVNRQINFQGKLVDNNGLNVADNSYNVVFSLYSTASGGIAIWTETDSVTTKAGIFQVELGTTNALPDNVTFNSDSLYLGIKVGSDAEMTPRIRFTAVPYALNSSSLDGVVATQSATGFNLQGGTSSQSTASFTTSGGALTFQPGVAEGLTIDTNGSNALSLGNSASSVTFGGNNNPTYEFKGTGGLTFDGTTISLANASSSTIQTTGANTGLTLLSQGSGNITLGQNAGNGNVVIAPNAGGQAALIVQDQGLGDLFTASAGATTKFTIGNNGVLTLSGGEYIDDNTTADTLILGSNGTNGGVIRVPVTNAGTSLESSVGAAGDIYYDSTKSTFRCYQGTGWQNCIPSVNFQSTSGSSTITLTTSEQSILSGSITPSATTSKIWINATAAIVAAANSAVNVTIRIRRGSCTTGTQVGVDQVVSPTGSGNSMTAAVNYVDTPGVTTSTTYNVCVFTSTGSPAVGGRGMTLYEPTGSAATAGLGSLTVQNSDTSNSVTGVSTLQFGGASSPTDTFTVTDETGGVARVQLGAQVGLLNQNETATGVWNFSNGLGIGTGNPLGALDVRGNTATTPIASLSGSTNFAGLVIDNSGSGDLLTASQGGVPHFTIQHNGTIVDSNYTTNGGLLYSTSNGTFNQLADVASGSCLTSAGATSVPTWTNCSTLGTNYLQLNANALSPGNSTYDLLLGGTATASARFAFVNNTGATTTPVASISANNGNNATSLSGTGILGTTNRQTLTLGSASTGNVVIAAGGTTALTVAGANLTGAGTFTSTGLITGNNGLTVSSGTINFAGFSGVLQAASGGNVTAGALDLSGSNVSNVLGVNNGGSPFTQNAGAISERLATQDLLLGSSATGSARFAFINVNANTPTASISANSGNNATYLTGAGVLGTTNAQTLTLGSGSTGDIAFNPGNVGVGNSLYLASNGNIGMGTSTPGTTLDVRLSGSNTGAVETIGNASQGKWGSLGISTGTGSPFQVFGIAGSDLALGANGNEYVRVQSGGHVGVNTTTLGNAAFVVNQPNNTGDIFAASQSGNAKFVINNAGNVGIGTTNPTQTLDVNGNARIETLTGSNGVLYTDSTGLVKQAATSSNGLCLVSSNTTLTPSWGSCSGVSSTVWNTLANPSSSLSLQMGTNTTAFNWATGTSTSNLFSLTTDASANGTGALLNLATGTGSSVAPLSISAGGKQAFYVTSNGMIGVGTTAAGNDELAVNQANSAGDIFSASQSGNTKFVIKNNGSVGIGTSAPVASLDVRGNSGTTPSASIEATSSFASLIVNNSGSGDLFTGSSSGVTQFTVTKNGNVNMNGTLTAIGRIVTNTGFNGNCLSGSTFKSSGTSNCNMDVAEIYPSTQDVASGDVVMIDPTATDAAVKKADSPYGQSLMGIVTTHPGIILGINGSEVAMGGDTTTYMQTADPRMPAVALDGKVPVKVSSMNGPIEPGDPLTASSIPGVAMKATEPGYIIGKALESYSGDPSAVGSVLVFVNISWDDPAVNMSAGGNYDLLQNSDLSLFDQSNTTASASGILNTYYTIQDGAGIAVTATTALAKATIANIQAGAVIAKQISTEQLNVTSGTIMLGGQTLHDYIAEVVKQVLSEQTNQPPAVSINGLLTATPSAQLIQSLLSQKDLSATVSGMTVTGVLGADTINTKHIAGLTDLRAAAISAASISAQSLTLDTATIQHIAGLTDLDATTITAASISAQTITADTINAKHISGLEVLTTGLKKDDARITALENLVASPSATPALSQQPTISPTEGITVLPNTTAQSSVSSDLRVKGNGLIEGILHIAGTLFANDFIANGISDFFGNVIFHTGVTFKETPTFTSDTAGIAIVKKGTDHVDVQFTKAYDQIPVVNASITEVSLTPTPSETPDQMQKRQQEIEQQLLSDNIHFAVIKRTTAGFTILLDKPADEDIAFSWLALSVQNSVIFQSQHQPSPTPADAVLPSPIDTVMPTDAATSSAGF